MVMMIMIIMWKPSQTKPSQAKPKPKPKPKLKLKPEPKKRASHGWTCLGHNKNTKQCSCLELQQQQPHLGQCNQDGNKYGSSSRSSIKMQLSGGLGLQQEERGLGGCWRSTYSPSKLRLQVNQSSQSRRRETRVISGSLWLDVGVWEKS